MEVVWGLATIAVASISAYFALRSARAAEGSHRKAQDSHRTAEESLRVAKDALRVADAARATADSAETRQRRARLTVASFQRASDVPGYVVTISNVGFASARHPEVTLLDRSFHPVGVGKAGAPVHPRDSVALQADLDNPDPLYPLRVRIDWDPYDDADDEGETWVISKLLIESEATKVTRPEPRAKAPVWRLRPAVLPIDATPADVAEHLADPPQGWSSACCTPMTWKQCLKLGKENGVLGEVRDASEWRLLVREKRLRVVSLNDRVIRWVRSDKASAVLQGPRHEFMRCIGDPEEPFREGFVRITEDDHVVVYRSDQGEP